MIHSCQPVIDLIVKAPRPISPATTQLLQSYNCGYEGRNPRVCCPDGASSSPTPVTQPPTPVTQPPEVANLPPDVSGHRNIDLINPINCGPIAIDRIYGGNKTAPFEFPWMVLIAYNTKTGLRFRCGGTLINKNYVLTAAHCITGLTDTSIAGVRLGEHDITKDIDCDTQAVDDCAPAVQDYTVAEIIPHPLYNTIQLQNDIGLIRINGEANMESEAVRPICLPSTETLRRENLVGRNGVVAGWGATETGYASDDLLKVDLPVISIQDCQNRYNNIVRQQIRLTEKQMCAGGVNGKDSCSGDSGGPLKSASVIHDDSRYVQFGVVSFGPKACGAAIQPGVYTNVPYYMDWILDNMKA